MKIQSIQVSSLVLIGFILLASVPLISAQTEDMYYVSMDSVDTKLENTESLKNVKEYNYATFTIKPDEFNDAISNNKNVVLEIMGKEVVLDLYETHVMGKDTKVM